MEIKLDPRNYRKHDKKNKDLINKSLKECGAGRSIVIDNEDNIIAGNGIYEQAQKLGLKTKIIETDGSELVVVKRTDLATEDEKRKQLAIMDNSTSDTSTFDFEILQADFDTETLIDYGLPIDFKIEEPQEVVEDEVPESVDTRCKRGDIWKLGNHRLMCGDSTVLTDVEKLMDGNKTDLVFTDPPYNVAIGDKNKALSSFGIAVGTTKSILNDSFKTDEECKEKLWLPAFSNMFMVANEDCSIYVTMPQGGTHMMMMMLAISEAGWQVKHELIWVKNQATFSMGRLDYDYQHEPICFGWNKTHKKIGKGQFTKSIWEIDKPKKSSDHPTMKPIELISNALLNSSNENDNVLDLFGGSGSTLIACEQLNRTSYMMELDEHYCDVIIQRWENLTGKKAERIEDGTDL